MVKVKPLEEGKLKYKEAATFVPARYERGVKAAVGVIEASIKGQALFEAKMTDPAVLKRREGALKRLTDEDWRKPALEIGKPRIGPGMLAKVDKWGKEWEPHRTALEALVLPDRVVDPMANIDNRLKAVVKTLIETKEKVKG